MSTAKWIRQKDAHHNSVAALQNLVKQLNVKVTNQKIENVLTENPDYPSLASISDSLNDWRVENLAVRLEPEDLTDVTFPVIAHMRPPVAADPEPDPLQEEGTSCEPEQKIETPRFVVVTSVDDEQAQFLDPENGWITETREAFLNQWNGIMLLVDAKKSSGDPDYRSSALMERLKKLRLPVILSAFTAMVIALITSGFLIQGSVLPWLPMLAAKLVGAAICILLLIQLVDKDNALVNKVCNLGNEPEKPEEHPTRSSCGENILNSRAATLFGWLSMSEVGAFYFLGGLLSVAIGLLSGSLSSVLYALVGMNLLALPYTFFSVYYQYRHQQWCNLCLAVQAVIWLEFVAGIVIWTSEVSVFDWNSLTILAWGYLIPMIAWSSLKSGLGKEKQLKEVRRRLNKYRRNPAIIEDMLAKGKKVQPTNIPNEVVLGNQDAAFTITIFSNPYCNPCRKAHQLLDQLLDELSDSIRVVFRFSAEGRPMGRIEKELERIQQDFDRTEDETRKKELTDWYGGTTPEEWTKKINDRIADKNRRNSIALTLHALAHLGETEKLHQAMSEWYNSEDKSDQGIAQWREKYPVNSDLLEEMKTSLREAQIWSQGVEVLGTPTVFVNDKELKNGLSYIPDLKYYIRAREEELEEEAVQQAAAALALEQPVEL